jgi:superfamily II DNA/RNA helicase
MQESGDESFIHRIGRTGRAGNVGKAISFFDPYDQSNVQKADIYIKVSKFYEN